MLDVMESEQDDDPAYRAWDLQVIGERNGVPVLRDGDFVYCGPYVIDLAAVRANWQPIAEAFEALMVPLREIVKGILASPAWAQLESLAQELQAAQGSNQRAQRLRHGFASYCPTHGEPTTGGLCRRCARASR